MLQRPNGIRMRSQLLFGVQNAAASRSLPRQSKYLRAPRGALLVIVKHGPAAVEVNLIGTPLTHWH